MIAKPKEGINIKRSFIAIPTVKSKLLTIDQVIKKNKIEKETGDFLGRSISEKTTEEIIAKKPNMAGGENKPIKGT